MKVLIRTGMFLGAMNLSLASYANDRVIYGDDDRREVYDPTNDEDLVTFAKSTAILVEDNKLKRSESGKVDLPGMTFRESMLLCADEPFGEQINPGFCSGFLVGPDLFATAGHCLDSQSACDQTSLIFDFGFQAQGQDLTNVPEANVYHCKSIVMRSQEPGLGKDFAIIKLDRIVEGRAPLAVRRVGQVEVGAPIAVIGHPSGLPTKISAGAKVRKNSEDLPYFVANLDTYGGNSGSAVFNMVTGEVEGILVRGETDFKYDSARSCYKSNKCTETGCRGEDVSRADTFTQWIP
jgi:V8-like Glu-specific endopeptidase